MLRLHKRQPLIVFGDQQGNDVTPFATRDNHRGALVHVSCITNEPALHGIDAGGITVHSLPKQVIDNLRTNQLCINSCLKSSARIGHAFISITNMVISLNSLQE